MPNPPGALACRAVGCMPRPHSGARKKRADVHCFQSLRSASAVAAQRRCDDLAPRKPRQHRWIRTRAAQVQPAQVRQPGQRRQIGDRRPGQVEILQAYSAASGARSLTFVPERSRLRSSVSRASGVGVAASRYRRGRAAPAAPGRRLAPCPRPACRSGNNLRVVAIAASGRRSCTGVKDRCRLCRSASDASGRHVGDPRSGQFQPAQCRQRRRAAQCR